MTKRDLSKMDRDSIIASERDHNDYNFKFVKRVANTPPSQTTTSLKANDGFQFMVTDLKKRNDTEISDEKSSEKQSGKENFNKTNFFGGLILGTITGGAFTFIFSSIFKK